MIVIKSIPIVQEVYNNVLQDSEKSFDAILKYVYLNETNKNIPTKSSSKEKGLDLLLNLKNAETSLVFNLCIFRELGNAKNNLICVR